MHEREEMKRDNTQATNHDAHGQMNAQAGDEHTTPNAEPEHCHLRWFVENLMPSAD